MKQFFEMLEASHNLNYWIYDKNGKLLESNCNSSAIEAFFSAGVSGKQEMLLRGQESYLPVLLGLPLGLVWIATFEKQGEQLLRCSVLGPALHTEISLRDMEEAFVTYPIPSKWKNDFIQILRNLPVLSITSLTRVAVMLHYQVTGEKISNLDVQSLVKPEITEDAKKRVAFRETYMMEQKLLAHVREGNLNFHPTISEAQGLNTKYLINKETNLNQLNTNLIIFTSLCARAAIESGILPDIAYSIAENYTQRLSFSESVTHSESIGHAMYREFIQLVHDNKQRTNMDKPIRNCCDYIGLHLEDELSMEILSHRVGYTPNYLSQKFTQEMGMTPSDYIRKMRIDRACQLLITTDLPIPEIGLRLRFCNRGYFSAVFKELMGMTPVEYRKQYQSL